MAVLQDTEWRVESAWIDALTTHQDDLDGVPIRRFSDFANAQAYPVVTVHCDSSGHPAEWGGRVGYDISLVTLQSWSYRTDDTTGRTCALNMGALRDYVRTPKLLAHLSESTGITFFGVREQDASFHEVGRNTHMRGIQIECWSLNNDAADESSSSSSSYESGKSSSSSSSSSSSTLVSLTSSSSSQSGSSSSSSVSDSSDSTLSSSSQSSVNSSSSSSSSVNSSSSSSSSP